MFDLIRDVRDHLDGLSEIVASPFFLNNGKIDLSRGDAALARHILIDESLVMSQIQIGFKSIDSHKCLSVFEWRHRPCVYLEIRIHLYNVYRISACFKQFSYGCGSDSFS